MLIKELHNAVKPASMVTTEACSTAAETDGCPVSNMLIMHILDAGDALHKVQ